MRIAIIADWLTVFGGAEHAILEIHKSFPEAPMFTSVTNKKRLGPLSKSDIRPTRLQKFYHLIGRHEVLLPVMPRAMEEIDLTGFDVLLSSSHAVAKGIIPSSKSVHVCYCHTPMRYAWEMEEQYLEDFRVPFFLRKSIRTMLKKIRRWDLSTAKRVDTFIANSHETARRIQEIYGRESTVIPPPVQERFFTNPLLPMEQRRGFLAVGRLVPYKRFDLLIEVANKKNLQLTIVGRGQEEARLKKIAGPTITFKGFVSDNELPKLYGESKAVLFPQLEDAGIVPLEAMACGTPVIAYGEGGAKEYVKENETGLLFSEQTEQSLSEVIDRFSGDAFKPEMLRDFALQFGAERFREEVKKIVIDAVKKYRKRDLAGGSLGM